LPKPLIIALLSSLGLFFIINIFIKDKIKSALIVSTIALSFFSFDILNVLFFEMNAWLSYGAILYDSLSLLTYLIFIVSLIFLIHSSKKDLSKINKLLNFFAVVVIAMQIVSIFNYQYKNSNSNLKTNYVYRTNTEIKTTDKELPDIYYIIVDAYGREDLLKDLYNYDNQKFISFLKDKGFYIADKSYSNYNQTFLSVVSALNLDYLDDLATEVGYEADTRRPLSTLLRNNAFEKTLQGQGYTFVTLPSTWTGTYKNQLSDIHLSAGYESNSFNSILVKKTPLILFFPDMRVEGTTNYVNGVLDTIPKIADLEETTFSYVHLLSPHPPFIFEADGSPINTVLNCMEGTDGSHYFKTCPGIEKYREQYIGQLSYISNRLEGIINEILLKSDTPPIIILQGDHGPGSMLDWDSAENSNVNERFSILNAYLVPEPIKEKLYPEISPVNSFRLLLNYLFDDNLDLLEDRSYFAVWDQPYNFIDITDSLDK